MTKIPLEELIEHQKQMLENYQANPVVESIARNILASLQRLQRIEAGLREPTLEECFAAGRGPEQKSGEFNEGGLPNTPEERMRFEEYMRGHCWEFGGYDHAKKCYDTVFVRMMYGVWRDRGSLSPAILLRGKP